MGPALHYSRRILPGRTSVMGPGVEGRPPHTLAGIPTGRSARTRWYRHSLNDYLSKKTSFSTRSLKSGMCLQNLLYNKTQSINKLID